MALVNSILWSLLLIVARSELSECMESFQELSLNNRKDLTKMIYNSGRDINDFGDQVACEKLENSRYVLISVKIKQFTVNLGLCGPAACKAEDYESGISSLKTFLSEHYPATKSVLESNSVEVTDVHKYNNRSLSGAGIASLMLIFLLLAIVITGTLLDNSSKPEKGFRGWKALAVCFSITSNFDKLVTFPQTTDSMQVFNGFKVLGMLYISFGHHLAYTMQAPSTNPTQALDILKNFWMHFAFTPIYVVDVFFVIAGFLVAFLTIKEMEKRRGKINWLMFVVHRLIRICPIYFFSFMIFMNLLDYVGTGTVWPTMWMKYEDSCQDWWANLIFLNNFFPTDDYGCMGWGWYVANDMQFYLFSPVVLIAFYKNKKLGYALLCLLILVSFVTLFIQATTRDYNPGILYGLMDRNQFIHSYQRPYTRVSAYAMGMILGFAFRAAVDSKPEKSENIELVERDGETALLPKKPVSRLTKFEIKLVAWAENPKYRIAAYIFGLVVIFGMSFVPYNFDNEGTDYWPKMLKVFFISLEHIIYSFALIVLLVPLIMGHGGILFRFLSNKYFAVASKITFSFYLFHPMVIILGGFNRSSANFLEYFTMVFYFPNTIILSVLIATLTTLCLESPVMALEKVIFRRH